MLTKNKKEVVIAPQKSGDKPKRLIEPKVIKAKSIKILKEFICHPD